MAEDYKLKKRALQTGPDVDIYQGNKQCRLQAQLCRAIKHQKEYRNNSKDLRQDFLKRRIEEEVAIKPMSKAATIPKCVKH
eukprot:10888263-Ditylum_brightwellii.AAC.1